MSQVLDQAARDQQIIPQSEPLSPAIQRQIEELMYKDKRTRCIEKLMKAGANRQVAELLADRSGITWQL